MLVPGTQLLIKTLVPFHVVINCVVIGLSAVHILHRIYFLILLVTRHRPLLGQVVVRALNHAMCNVDSQKAVETLIHRKCYGYYFLHDA